MKKSCFYDFICDQYTKITGNQPEGKDEYELAKSIIEVFGDRKILEERTESALENCFRKEIEFPDTRAKATLINDMEGFQIRAEKPAFGDKYPSVN